MLVGLISDTHNQLARTTRAVEMLREQGCAALIHCGDLTGPEIVRACAVLPLWFVLGNNDADNVTALEAAARECGATCLGWGGVVELAGHRLGVVHGHLSSDLRGVLAAQPEYLLSGHSHFALDWRSDGLRRINPGALHRAEEYTVAVLNLETEACWFLRVL